MWPQGAKRVIYDSAPDNWVWPPGALIQNVLLITHLVLSTNCTNTWCSYPECTPYHPFGAKYKLYKHLGLLSRVYTISSICGRVHSVHTASVMIWTIWRSIQKSWEFLTVLFGCFRSILFVSSPVSCSKRLHLKLISFSGAPHRT